MHMAIRIKVVMAIDGDMISSVLDAARYFLLVTASSDGTVIHKDALIADIEDNVIQHRLGILGTGTGGNAHQPSR